MNLKLGEENSDISNYYQTKKQLDICSSYFLFLICQPVVPFEKV